ncbi:hypothetical protein EMCG_05007 [[Emmonsia] crescens]|uniref:Uncharacterized protein n=1 Tax=[Emmonsia] crescens TaxID=73230 RepID=A0A0G2HRC7_9EURO|nr:hypothetical protein EMCG_05007 [Emmonsia crescens UAMH 3008]
MSSKADATMPKAGKLDPLDQLIEVDDLDEALAAIENIPDEESIKSQIGKAEAILDSQTTTAPHRLEKAPPRSTSTTGIRLDVRNQSPVRNVHAQESNSTRPPVPPHKLAAGKDIIFTPRSHVEKELPKYPHRGGLDDPAGFELTHHVHRGITQVGMGGSFAERAKRVALEPGMENMYQELIHQRRTTQHLFRQMEYYKNVAESLHKELEDCKKDLWEAQDEKKVLGQQILDLGTVAEGVTDEVLRRLFQSATGCAVESHSKVFGKPTGDDDERLGKLLSPECTQLLRQFGRKYYHSLLASALFKETSNAVGNKYVVGAASGILKLAREQLGVELNPQSSFTFLQVLEQILHLPSMGVPSRDINAWRSSFVKLLQYIPEVSELANSSGSKASVDSELSGLVDEVWNRLKPHIPPGDKGRRSLQKLLKLQANLRLKTCLSLASYQFKSHKIGTQYNTTTMSIVDITEGECEDDELHRLESESCGRKLVVGYCFFPALYKWGNDRGFDNEKCHVVARAIVLPVYDDDPFLQQQQILQGKFT